MSASRRFKSWANLAALAAGALIFVGVLYSLGLKETWHALSCVRPGWLLVTVVFYLLSAYLRIYKWTLMRDRMRSPLTFSELSSAYFSSSFWGMVSPMRSSGGVPAFLRGNKQGNLPLHNTLRQGDRNLSEPYGLHRRLLYFLRDVLGHALRLRAGGGYSRRSAYSFFFLWCGRRARGFTDGRTQYL